MDDAMHCAAAFLRNSYVDRLQAAVFWGCSITLRPNHWTSLLKAIRTAVVLHLEFNGADFSAFDDDMFLAAVGCRGLKSFAVGGSVVPSGFITDALLRASVANNVLQPSLFGIGIEMPVGPSDDAILDFCFSPYTAPGGQCRSLMIEYSGITDLFLTKFFKRLQSGDVRPAGNLKFFGGPPKQRGLSAYAQHLAPGRTDGTDVRYRFPPVDDDSKHYEVVLYESYFTDVSFGKRSYFDDIDEQDEYKSFRDRRLRRRRTRRRRNGYAGEERGRLMD